MSALSDVLAAAKAEDRAVLVGYLPVGYPSVDGSIAAMRAMVAGGCDVIEVGLPYSDPVLDGPTIQRAVEAALRGGTRTDDVFRAVAAVTDAGAPAVVMTAWNPIERRGVRRFAEDLSAAGGSGAILPDIVPEEAGEWLEAAAATGLDSVFLVAPSSTDARIASTVAACRGFVYAASLMGVTGTRSAVSASASVIVDRVRQATDTLPVCVGLGVSDATQAGEVAAYADGVIVGSAFVRALLDAPDEPAAVAAVRRLAQELAAGVRAGR